MDTMRGQSAHAGWLDEAAELLDTSATSSALLTIKQAAAHLQVGHRTVWRLIERGTLRAVHVGARTTRIRRVDLDEFIRARTT